LAEFISDACALNIKNSHHTGFEAAAKEWKLGVSSYAKSLIYRR
jgi:hypothetical protein